MPYRNVGHFLYFPKSSELRLSIVATLLTRMILSESDILKFLKEKPNCAVLDEARKNSKKFKAHITGEGNDSLIELLTGLENIKQLELRKKYGRSNVDLFQRIHEPTSKVFTAKGTSRFYQLSEKQQKDFIAKLNNIHNGFSMQNWIKSFALQYYRIDPMGLVFMEISKTGEQVYPIYKSTSKIYDYQLKGRSVEYVIFTTSEPNIYRVVDDAFDRLIKWEGNATSFTEIPDKTFPNYFGKVTARIISDIVKPNSDNYTSPDWKLIELADEFLREGSVKSIFKLKFGYSKHWQYASTCQSCKGTGQVEGETCNTCNGSGKSVSKDISDILVLPIPQENQPTITPNVAGYITPDIAGWDKMTDELALLESLMYRTAWNTQGNVKTQGLTPDKTATEIMTDLQPMNDKLIEYSKWAADIETFITDISAEFYYGQSYGGCSINYGTRYLLEGPDVIWKKYEEARKAGSPQSTLDDLLTEYYQTKYSTNSIELDKFLKLMKVEPFVHMTISEAKNLVFNPKDFNSKLYYSEWLNQLPPNEVMIKKVSELIQSLNEYTGAKEVPKPEPIKSQFI